MTRHFLLSFLVAVSLLSSSSLASILAIDYGTDWIKASLMKPGVPFDVVLNRDSKRKTQASVGWKREERVFHTEAFDISTRFPSDSFSSLKLLAGQPHGSSSAAFYTSLYPQITLTKSPKGSIGLRRPQGAEWTVEELIAMQLAYVKETAEEIGGQPIKDVVLTVPSSATQYERQALNDAIQVAGLRPVTLVSDGTAIAVNFAMTRSFAAPEYHVIYDAGASGVRATVVQFSTVSVPDPATKKSKNPKTIDTTQVEVKGFASERYGGGNELSNRLRDIIAAKFERANGKERGSLSKNPKAWAKLWKEVAKAKTILSANADVMVSIESLAWDLDLRTKVTRAEFEKACADLKGPFVDPILIAVSEAGLKLEDISSVILAGSSSRVPMVQAAIKKAVGDKIAQNVNADEAAVLGAAFYGASLSRQFKTKSMKVQDINSSLDIQVSYQAESKTTGSERTIHTLIFPTGSKFGSKKTLTLKRKNDFKLAVSYKHADGIDIPAQIFQAEIKGVAEKVASLQEQGAPETVVKVTVTLTDSGLVAVQEAAVWGDVIPPAPKKKESFAGKLKDYFAGSSSESESATSESSSTSTSSETSSASGSETTSTTSSNEPPKPVPTSLPLEVVTEHLSLPPLTAEELSASRTKLMAIDAAEKNLRLKEEARNMLEGYLYRLRDLLNGEASSSFRSFAKDSEQAALRQKMEENFAWLAEHGDSAETKEIWARRDEMEQLEKPIQHRYKEAEAGPKALADYQQALFAGRLWLNSARENQTAEAESDLPPKYTPEEVDGIQAELIEHERWLKDMTDKQKALAKNDDPVLLAKDMETRGVTFQAKVMKLIKRKAPKKKASSSVTEESTTTSTAEANEKPTTSGAGGHDEL